MITQILWLNIFVPKIKIQDEDIVHAITMKESSDPGAPAYSEHSDYYNVLLCFKNDNHN